MDRSAANHQVSIAGCEEAHRLALKICLQERVIMIDPMARMRLMSRKYTGAYHIYISDGTNYEANETEAYKFAVGWWSRAVGNLMQLIYTVWPDTVREAQYSDFLVASQCSPSVELVGNALEKDSLRAESQEEEDEDSSSLDWGCPGPIRVDPSIQLRQAAPAEVLTR